MQDILVIHEKHRDRYFNVPEGKITPVLMKVFEHLRAEGYWDEESAALDKVNATNITSFLRSRCDCEYEDYELITPETLIAPAQHDTKD